MIGHLSHVPARALFAQWDAAPPTPQNDPRALAALDAARALLANRPKKPGLSAAARTWGALPRWARRLVLSGSGIDPAFWERPIDSFSAVERARIGAAAREAVRVCAEVAYVA
jgi:hypothetical protein